MDTQNQCICRQKLALHVPIVLPHIQTFLVIIEPLPCAGASEKTAQQVSAIVEVIWAAAAQPLVMGLAGASIYFPTLPAGTALRVLALTAIGTTLSVCHRPDLSLQCSASMEHVTKPATARLLPCLLPPWWQLQCTNHAQLLPS